MKIKVEHKVTVLSDTLKEFFGDKMNLARIKLFGLFISTLCFALLPHEPPYRLALDRTNLKFGNSGMQERIDLMERFVRLFGSESIECLLDDRELCYII